jgi:hypothetical protein
MRATDKCAYEMMFVYTYYDAGEHRTVGTHRLLRCTSLPKEVGRGPVRFALGSSLQRTVKEKLVSMRICKLINREQRASVRGQCGRSCCFGQLQ